MKLGKVLYWLFILFIIYLTIEIIRNILGGSLSTDEILTGLVFANLGYTFHLNSKLSEHLGWHKGKDHT